MEEVVCYRCGGHYLLDHLYGVYLDWDDTAERYAIIQVNERNAARLQGREEPDNEIH